MARSKNSVETIQLTLSVTPAVRDYLVYLSESGYYGKNAADTATLLLSEKLRQVRATPGGSGGEP